MLGAQFEQVTGGTAIDGLITGVNGVAYDAEGVFEATAPQIQVPTAGGYDIRYFLTDGWYQDAEGNDAYKAGWCNEAGEICDTEVTPGVAIWLKSVDADVQVTVAGAVPEVDSVSVECPKVFSLRANAYPMAITLNTDAMKFVNIAGVDYDAESAFEGTAPQMQIPTAGGYDIRYYLNDGWYQDAEGNDAYKAGWCNEAGELSADVIPVAQGFWLKGNGSTFTVTFTK